MTTCTRCGGSYEGVVRFCPRDGEPLADEPDPYIGRVLLGQFELTGRIGAGAMGTVYRAWQNTMDRQVAVKVLRRQLLVDPSVVKRFYREARAVARLAHPNIITVFLVGECDDGAPYIVMELVDGPSLAQVLAEGRIDLGRTVRIATQIANALAEAHAAGVVHRDLKPENILLAPRRQKTDLVKVLDFGIAKLLSGAGESQSHLTSSGALFGTPHYLAPEQAAGADVDHRADLYSLGVLLYRMLTGRLPFDGQSGMQVVLAHLSDTPPPPRALAPELPAALEAVVLRAMAKDPAERFQSADELAAALAKLDAPAEPRRTVLGMSAAVEPDSEPEPTERARPRSRRLMMWAPVVAIAAAGASLGRLYLGNGTQAAPKPAAASAFALAPVPPPPPPAAQSPHSLRLAEEGYAFEVAPPEAAQAGAPLSFVVDVDDPEGKPVRGARLELGIRGPDKTQPEQTVVGHESAPGRYVAACVVKQSGTHHIHLYATTRRGERLKVWFDLAVAPGETALAAAMPAPAARHRRKEEPPVAEPAPGPPPAAAPAGASVSPDASAGSLAAGPPVDEPQPQPAPASELATPAPEPAPAPPAAPAQTQITPKTPPRVVPPGPLAPPRYVPRPWRYRRLTPPPPGY